MSENAVETAVVAETVEVVAEEIVAIDPTRKISSLTVAEFRQLMVEIAPKRKSQGPRSTPAEVPEGYSMTVNDIIAKTGMHGMTVRRLCREGLFGADASVKVGARWFTQPETVDAYLNAKVVKKAKAAETKAAKAAAKANAKVAKDAVVDAEAIEDELDLEELDLDEDEDEVELVADES